jgi:hypothetical protein
MTASACQRMTQGKARAGRHIVILILASCLLGCDAGETRNAVSYWRTLRQKSIEVTKDFLVSAAANDSAALSRVATDSVTREVLFYHDAGYAEDLREAGKSFQITTVTRYGWGATVMFKYRYKGNVPQAGSVTTSFDRGALRVQSFALPLKT